MLSKISKGVGDRISYMQALSEELRGIAFHIENTDAAAYGNTGCEHGRYRKRLQNCLKISGAKNKRLLNSLSHRRPPKAFRTAGGSFLLSRGDLTAERKI